MNYVLRTKRDCDMVGIRTILAKAIEKGASDVHINVGIPPVCRKNTELLDMDFPAVSNEDVREMVVAMIGVDRFKKLEENKDFDFSTSIDDGHRFRVNAHYQRSTIAISFRVIPNQIPLIDDLNLPPIVKELTDMPRGLVIVTGHTGSGKSTTLAGMIGLINRKYKKRIVTLEDPVEYLLENEMSMIEQREIGFDCPNFALGLRHVLRQDPDIIMVGEMRDLETTSSTITAAEANTLQAVISQTLFRRIDEPGMVPCAEILLCTSAVRNCIRENRIYEIPNIIETSRRLGMQNMDNSIADRYFKGFIDREEAIARSSNPGKMEKLLTPVEQFEVIQPPEGASIL